MPTSEEDRPRYRPALIGAWLDYLGMSARQFALRVNISEQQIGRLITGKRPYTQETLETIAHALDVSVLELLFVDPRIPSARERLAAEITRLPPQRQVEAISYLRFLAESRDPIEPPPSPQPAAPHRTRKRTRDGGG